VKLGRVLMLAPVAAATGIRERRGSGRGGTMTGEDEKTRAAGPATPLVPLFVVGFLAMVVLRSLGILPAPLLDAGHTAATVLLAAGMFGLGAGIDIRRLLRTGGRFAAVGAVSTLLLAGVSLLGVVLA
jgi:uncharacterized membrane protein YadS